MTLVHRWLPAWLFGALAFEMFSYLFAWTDARWDRERKAHYFRFTPQPTSSRSILHWTDIAKRGWLAPFQPCPLLVTGAGAGAGAGADPLAPHHRRATTTTTTTRIPPPTVAAAPSMNGGYVALSSEEDLPGARWASRRRVEERGANGDLDLDLDLDEQPQSPDALSSDVYDLSPMHRIPLLLVWGERDHLVDARRMLDVFDGYARQRRGGQSGGQRNQGGGADADGGTGDDGTDCTTMNIQLREQVAGYEHLDFLWARDAHEKVWSKVHSVLERLDASDQ